MKPSVLSIYCEPWLVISAGKVEKAYHCLVNVLPNVIKCHARYWKVRERGAHPTNDISIESEILPKFGVFWFKMSFTDHNEILHMSQQLHCCDVCKILLWSVEYILSQITAKFCRISYSIEILLVGRAHGLISLQVFDFQVQKLPDFVKWMFLTHCCLNKITATFQTTFSGAFSRKESS